MYLPLWEGYHESRRCSRDTYPESYITKLLIFEKYCLLLGVAYRSCEEEEEGEFDRSRGER